jgi:hypothetical protein
VTVATPFAPVVTVFEENMPQPRLKLGEAVCTTVMLSTSPAPTGAPSGVLTVTVIVTVPVTSVTLGALEVTTTVFGAAVCVMVTGAVAPVSASLAVTEHGSAVELALYVAVYAPLALVVAIAGVIVPHVAGETVNAI